MSDTNEPKVIGTFDITPVGLKVPGGPERVAKAQKAWESMQARVANDTSNFLRANLDVIAQALTFASQSSRPMLERKDANEMKDELREIQALCKEMGDLQEEFMRAISGAPPRKVSA